ncbi:MAG: hypothetical protein AB7P04_05400 [Bacteriovoracia bacterium]
MGSFYSLQVGAVLFILALTTGCGPGALNRDDVVGARAVNPQAPAPQIVPIPDEPSATETRIVPTERTVPSTVTRDKRFIYYRTAWKDMRGSAKKAAVKSSISMLQDTLQILLGINTRSSGAQVFTDDLLDQVIKDARDNTEVAEGMGITVRDLIPSGFFVFGNVSISGKWVLGAGGSADLMLVAVPVEVVRVSIQDPQQVYHYVELDWALAAIPQLHAGAGAGGQVGFEFGAGLIWGALHHAKDFAGPLGALSATAKFGIGLELMAGVVRNMGLKRNFPFLSLAIDTGVAAEIAVNANGGVVLPLDKLSSLVLGTPADTFSGTSKAPVY